MSLSDVWFLYRARLRSRAVLVQEGFVVAGIAIGVALLFASQIASTSLNRSVARISRQILGNSQYQLDARGPSGMDERLVERVRAVGGVGVVLPVLEVQGNLVGPDGQRSIYLFGTDPRFVRLVGPSLSRLSPTQLAAQQAVVLPGTLAQSIGVGPLQTAQLQLMGTSVPLLVGATLGEADIGELVNSPVAFAAIRYVQKVAQLPRRVSRVFVGVTPGSARTVHRALERLAVAGHINLEPATFDSTLFAVAAYPASKSESLFSMISAIVGFMFALNALLLTVPSRRRLIADVRHHGATRTMTLQILLFDMFILGTLACTLGLAFGDLLSVAVFHTSPGYLSIAFPVGNGRVVTWRSILLSVAAGMLAAGIGVLWPLRDLIARPLHEVKEHRSPSGFVRAARAVVGLLCLLATSVILVAYPQAAIAGVFTSVMALVCLLPSLFDVVVDTFNYLQRPFNKTSPLLAVTELRTPQTRVRSLAIAATTAIAVFGIVAIHGSQVNLQHGLNASAHDIARSADIWISPRGESDIFATIPFEGNRFGALAALPGVESVGMYRGSFLDWESRRLWVLAPPSTSRHPVPASQLARGDLPSVNMRLREGGWALVSQKVASEHRLMYGDTFTLPSPDPIKLRLAGLLTNLGWSPGAIVMSSTDYARAWGSDAPSAYQLNLRPGASAAVVRRLAIQALGASNAGLVVETAGERQKRDEATSHQGLSRLTEIRYLVLVAAMLAVAGAIGSMIWQRRDLVAFIKCQGYRRGVLWRWLLCECMLMLVAGCAVGTGFGLYGQLLLSHALGSVTGFPIAFHLGAEVALSSFVLVTVTAVAIVAVAGYLVVRVPPRTVSSAY
jgi:putative ABC transport system permease protein